MYARMKGHIKIFNEVLITVLIHSAFQGPDRVRIEFPIKVRMKALIRALIKAPMKLQSKNVMKRFRSQSRPSL